MDQKNPLMSLLVAKSLTKPALDFMSVFRVFLVVGGRQAASSLTDTICWTEKDFHMNIFLMKFLKFLQPQPK